jgi:hypothetical protein
MWIGAKNVRWCVLISEQRFRIFRRDFVADPSSMHYGQPYIVMSPTIANNSNTMPLIPLIIYMLLTGREDVVGLLPPSKIEVTFSIIPNDTPHDTGKGKQHFTRSVATGRKSATSPLPAIREHAYGAIDVTVLRHLFHLRHACFQSKFPLTSLLTAPYF